ncbi:hypothetical protein AtEden1_Chr3g0210871 [Arabidopsis thaliana]|uniref:Transmembrane protein n=1 Tax=Arabidopsis thaliana TaxID=3702 RepID=Q8GX88_ARATH|nr:unknown protein [Arabidopsis thaliana]
MPVNFRSWFIWLKRELCLCVKSSIMFYFVFLRRFPMSGLSVGVSFLAGLCTGGLYPAGFVVP